jgi:mRNA-degrading endonuclease RelE of RelBE toxin-antitoxin system
MSYEVIFTPQFEKDIKYYLKKKKYTKILDDVDEIVVELEKGNFLGAEIAALKLPTDYSLYTVRVANSSINVGKTHGFRLIYYVVKDDKEVFLLTIYSKKDREDISRNEIIDLLKMYCT